MSSDYSRDDVLERGSIPLDIDNIQLLLQVEQEQIQKKTFTNWVNAQLAKRRPPCMVVDLFNDFRDGSKLLELLEVMSGQRLSRERGRGMFQHRSNIEKALSFLRNKSIKLVNINIPDIINGKPSIVLGLIWTIILQYHIEELASGLSFSSRQSSMESLTSLDSRSTLSSRSATSSPVPPRGSPLHNRFKVSAKKALLLWVREQCHKAGCTLNVKDFKASWRSGVVFLAILYALRPDLVDLSKARTRSNKQNLEEAFCIAEKELRIPRLLDPDDVDVRDPDEKSIMTYVAQFLQYSRDLPAAEEETQATPDRKAKEVTCWLVQAYDELLEGWDSTDGESYSERYHVFHTFLVSFNEQRRPIMPLLTVMRRTPKLSEEQRALREAWDALTAKIREYKVELDMSLPAPLDTVARWLLKTEGALAEEEGEPQDHGRAADEAREKQELLRVCLEEMPQHLKTFQSFQNLDEYGNVMVPTDKMDELKRRFTGVRVSAKYHGIKLEYREHRHTVLDLLGQVRTKLRLWKRPYISPEAVRVLLQEWHELVNRQELTSLLEATLHKLKQVSEKYSSKSALSADYPHVRQQVKQLGEDTAVVLEEVTTSKSTMSRVLSAWDSYSDCLSSLQAWLEQGSVRHSQGHRPEVTSESIAEWGSRQAYLNEVGNFLIESTDPQTSRSLAEELRRLNMHWAEFVKRNTFDSKAEPGADVQARPQDVQALLKEATLLLKEPLEATAGPLLTYRKRIQFILRKIKEVDLEALTPSPECPADQLQKLKPALLEVMQTLLEAEQVCADLQHSVSGLDSRLAELLHWETEARGLYQLLRATERQQRGQDPRAKVLISRGLQLEGQVVTEEQDVQVMVMKSQKNSPIQYLHASAMQDRVRAAVAQSQEAVGMLSSLGARRDRSRSPPEGPPPSKVFIQAKEKPQYMIESDTGHQAQQVETKSVSHPCHETFVPKIVVQEYREKRMTSPPMPYTYAQAVTQIRTKSPPEGQDAALPESAVQIQQQVQGQGLILQQQPPLQEQLQQQTAIEREHQEHKQQLTQEAQQELMPTEPQQQELEQQQHLEIHQDQVQRRVVTQVQVETQVRQTPEHYEQMLPHQQPGRKSPLSSQELKSRKAQAMKNRPWLQKPASGKHKTSAPDAERYSTEGPVQAEPQSDKETVGSVQLVPQHTAAARPLPETQAKVTEQPQQNTQRLHKQEQQQQEQLQHQQQQQKEKHQKQQPQHMEKQPKQKEQLLPQEQQKQPQELLPVLRQTEPHSDTKAESQTTTMMQPHPQTGPKVQNQSQPQTTVYQKSQTVVQVQSTSVSHTTIESLQPAKTMSQTIVSEGQPPSQVLPLPHGLMKTQSLTQSQTQLQLQPQVQTHTQACVPGGPQPSMQPQALGHGPDGAQITPSSPMQAPLQGHIQPPVPSHIQLRSHPQSWAHVRPPSPKPQTHAPVESQSVPQPQTHAQPKIQSQAHVQSVTQGLIHAQPMTHNQPLAQQTQAQFAVQPQIHSQPITQPAVQSGHSQVHAWSQVRTSSPLSIPHPQATTQPPFYPQGYSQGKSPPFQWIPKQESQNQAISQQTHPIPQPYPQQIGQSPQSQAYPAAQPVPQWSQAGSQVGPQLGHPGYSHMGPSYTRPQFQPQVQTQPWAQTQPQVRPHGSMQQQPQMRTYDMFHIQTQQSQVQHQTWAQAPPQIQPQSYSQLQPQPYSQLQPQPHSQQYSQVQHHPLPQMQASIPTQSQPPHHTHSQPQLQPQLQAQSQAQIQTQPLRKVKPHVQTQQSQLSLQFQQPPHPKHQTQPQTPPKTQSATQPKGELPTQPKPPVQLAPQPEVKTPAQPTVQSPTQPKAESLPQPIHEPLLSLQPMTQAPIKSELPPQPKLQAQTTPLVEAQSPAQPKPQVQLPPQLQAHSPPLPKSQMAPPAEGQVKVQSPTQPKVQTLPQPKPQTQLPPLPQLPAESPPSLKAQTAQQSKAQSPPQARPQTQPLPQSKTQAQSPTQPKCQPSRTILLSQVNVLPQSLAESPDLCITPPALAQAPPQAYTEAYAKAQALARNGFEEAKHCLQEHILEAINVFQDKGISAEQASVKEETLRTLDPELLEEFLRAAKGMEAFCTPSQLRDMEVYTQSVRTQWEACISVDASFAEAGKHLEALKGLCDTLSPEDAHRLAQTQLRECETRLAAIQRQFSGDQDAQLPDSRVPVAFSEDLTVQKEPTRPSDKPPVSTEVFQVTMKTVSVERREVEKQASVEEVTKQDALERYENCKRTLQSQLAKNEQSIMDLPSDSVSLKGLHTRLQEIQFLRQETESLWSEYANQCSQVNGNSGLEQEKAELQEQWRNQQSNLQRRGSSLGAALRQIDSTENHMVDFADRLDRYLRQPKDISGFTLANTNILKDIKDLDDNIQSELDQVSRLDPESSDLDPRDCFPLSRQVETHRTSLDQLRQQVRKSEAAARALDRFLMSLRTVDEDISGVQGAPCSDAQVLQDCRSKLALIRQSIDSLKEKAPQLDLLLQGARLTVTRDGVPASCLDMVTVLLRRLEEADSGLASQQKVIQKETQSKSLGLRKRTLLGELRRLQDAIEMQGLKEPTMPAVQHRLRALSDLEGQLQTQHTELQNLRELQDKQGGGENLFDELETQWKETQKAFSDSKKQCNTLLELLKKFRNCRSHLSNTMQKAEQTISDQASYMGKDNLQRSITKVCHIKEELAGLGERIEEMRGVCRQLQSQLKKFPDCSEALFEAEADTLMDSWLDVTEKTDACMDNLQVGLELWERQLMLGGEVDGWAGAKLALFAESHPFHSEQQVLDMRDEIHTNEENIEHFHKKSVEIQEMLQSQEAPLELQVMETQLRKRMQQVKELFTDCTDVFEELIAVKRHLAEKIEECQSAVENIQGSLSKVDALQPKVEAQIQDLCDDLEAQEEQAEAVLKEVGLVSSVASPQVVEALTVDCSRLREAISRTKDMMHLKREERDKGLLKVIEDERQSFEGWFQDMQVSVNECFENPESKTDVETSLQRLAGFLKSKDAERRLEQLRDQLERGSQQFPPQQLSDFSDWLKEQQKEVGMFTTHCHNRQKQMESLLNDLNSLQKQHDGFRDWLQIKEKRSVESDKVKRLLKDLQDESGRAETLSELLASVRRQGVRAESLLKDGDNLIQRYRNLEARLQREADAQRKLEEELDKFSAEAESARTWITDLLKPLTSTGTETQTEEMKRTAQAVLSSKAEGDSKLNNLRRESERLCECEDLKEDRKQEVQQSVRDTEERWGTALQAAEEALNKAETQAQLDENIDAFRAQNENVQSWIRDQEQNLQSLGDSVQVDEKLEIAKATLSSKPDGDSKLQDLKQRCQSLCDNQGLDESRRQEVQDTVRHTEEQWRKVLTAAEEALNKAETEAETERDFDAFRSQSQNLQSWIKEQKQKLLSHGSQTLFEERLQVAQAVTTSRPEGESKVLDLKRRGESLCELVEESRKAEVQQLVNDAQQQWKTVIQAAGQAELRALSDDFDGQSKNTQSWIRDRQQELQTVGTHTSTEERIHTARNILSSKPEGDCKVNNLRRRGQSLCDHPGADEGRKVHVQQTVRDTEEQWRTVLQAAKQAEDAAGAEITQRTERRKSELREFDALQQDTSSWLTDLQHQLDSLKSQTKAEDRLHSAQTTMSSKPEGDFKLQELRRKVQSLCGQDLEEDKKLQLKVKGAEEQWMRIMQNAKQALDRAERECALEGQLRDFKALSENTRTWLEDKQQSLDRLDSQTDLEKTINTAQTILSCKPEGDSKLAELSRQSQSLSEQEDLEESVGWEAQRSVEESEEQWGAVLQSAENTLKKAEVQYSLYRELEAFRSQAGSTKTWLRELQQQAESKGSNTQGGRPQLEDRLNTAQAILSSRSSGEAQVTGLKRRAQSLCEQKDLEGDKKQEVEQLVRDAEQQWRTVLKAAEDTQRQLKSVVERLVSCQQQRHQADARLSKLQKRTSNLPCLFQWPGLGERRQAVEQARTLLDEATALAPVLSDVCRQAAELFEITQDQDWSDPSWTAKEESIPALLKELTDAVANLEEGILTERQCTQLLEQHEAAQDWLREHVKGLGAPPADRQGLHSTVNTLKALLQTVNREQREMQELDSARDSLLSLCTPGGRDALTLQVSHLHDLCTTSEQEVRERLTVCETRLGELARRAQGLKERAAALQWELRSLDQALSYSEPQNNIAQLQQHWHSLQNCEKSLEDLGVKVHELNQEVKETPAADELPTEIIAGVESLCQQHDSLQARLSEHQETCSTNTSRCLMDCLHALKDWNHNKPSESSSSVQVTLNKGEKLQDSLQEALSHQQFLTDCLTSVLFEKLEKEASETLREADTHKASLNQSLKELDEMFKQKQPDVLHGNAEETRPSVVAPPRKNKCSAEKNLQKNVPLAEKSVHDEMSVSAELQTETKKLKPTVTVDTKITDVEQITTEPTGEEPQSSTCVSEPFTAPSANEQIKPAVEEPALIQKLIEQSAPAVTEKTTPVPSRRKTKTSATETEPGQTKVAPRKVETIITQGSSRHQSGTAAVEEPKNMDTVSVPVSITEQAATAVVEQAKLGPTGKESQNLNITQIKPAQIKDDAENQSVSPSELLTETDSEHSKSVPKKQKSKTSTTSEPVATQSDIGEYTQLEKSKEEPKNGKTSSAAQKTDLVKEPEKSSASEFVSEVTETANLKQSEVLPPKRKSRSPNLPLKQADEQVAKMTEELESQSSPLSFKEKTEGVVIEETKLIPTRRKSKNVEITSTLQQMEPEDNKKEPDSLKSSSTPQVVTEPTVIEKENKLSPIKGTSNISILSLECATKEMTENKQETKNIETISLDISEPGAQAPLIADIVIPARRKSKSLEVLVPESVSPIDKDAGVESKETKQETVNDPATPEFVQDRAEIDVVEQTKFLPPKRKSKNTELPLKLVDTVVPEEPESQSVSDQRESVVTEQTMLVPSRRRSKTSDFSATSQTITHVRSPDVDPEQNKTEPSSQKCSTPDVGTGASQSTVVEKETGKLSPTKRKTKGLKLSPELATKDVTKTIKEPDTQKSLEQSEAVVSEETKLIPTRMKSKRRDVSIPLEPAIGGTGDLDSKEASKELESGSASSIAQVIRAKSETTVVGESDLLPTTSKSKSPNISPERSHKESQAVEKHSKLSQSTEDTVMEETKVIPCRRKSKEGPNSQKPTEITVTPVVEKGKLSPTKRKQKVLKHSPELPKLELLQPREGPDTQELSSTLEVVTDTTEVTVVENDQLSPTKRESDDVKPSPELGDTELRKAEEEPESEKPSSIPEVATGPTEITETPVEEKGKLSPTERKSKGLKLSPELPTTELTQSKEGPDTQTPSSAPRVITETTECSVVDKGTLSPTKRQQTESAVMEEAKVIPTRREPKSEESPNAPEKASTLKRNTDETLTEHESVKSSVTPDSAQAEPSEPLITSVLTMAKPPHSELDEPKDRCEEEQVITQSVEKVSSQVPHPQTPEKSSLADYIDKLLKSTDEFQKRYLVLDLPETGVSQTYEMKQEAETVVESEAAQSAFADLAVVQPHKAETEFSEISLSEQDRVTLSEAVSELTCLETTQERPKDVREHGVKEERDLHQSSIQCKTEPQSKDMTGNDIQREKVRVKMTRLEVEESMSQCQDNVAKSDSTQPGAAVFTAVEPSETDTISLQISISEQETVKPSQSLEIFKTTQETPREVKEEHGKVLTGINDEPKYLDDKPLQKIHMGPEVCILQLDIQAGPEEDNAAITSAEGINSVQTSMQSKRVPENKGITTAEVTLEKAAVTETMMKVQESSALGQDSVPERDSTQLTSPDYESLQPHVTEFIEISIYEQDIEIPSQTGTRIELLKTASTQVKEHRVQEEYPKVSTHDMHEEVTESKDLTFADVYPEKDTVKMKTEEHDLQNQDSTLTHDMDGAPKSLNEKSVIMEKLHKEADVETLQLNTPTFQVEEENISAMTAKAPSIQCENIPGNKDRTTADLQPESVHDAEMSPSDMHDVPKSLDESSVKKGEMVQDPVPLTTTAVEGRLQSMDLSQAVQKSSTDIFLDNVSLVEGLPSQENKAQPEESVVKTEDHVIELPESTMGNIFTEVQLLAGTGPNSQLIKGKLLEDAPEALITSTGDLDNRLSRLTCKVLSCKNQPAVLSPTAMAQQLEEAQECRNTARAQVSLLSHLRGANTENREALELVKDKWCTAVQDAAAVIQSKEAQLQVVTDYCRQTQEAKTKLERLTADLNAVRMSPVESSLKETERLCSLQRSIEENRTVLGEMLVTHTKLSPHLSRSERAAAQTELRSLQEKWSGLEGDVDRMLYYTNVHSHETSSLLSTISSLQEHLETIGKDLEAKSPSATQWNCKKAQELMVANAEVKAAQQTLLHLHQLSEALLLSSQWEKEIKEIQQGLQKVKDQLSHIEELVSSHTQSSSNPIMEKMIVVMRDGLAWAKQTETDIEGRRKRVALLPEDVHRQFRDLKKLQFEVMAKQGQLESLVEEVTELLPQLDQAEEVPMVRSSLEFLEELSKSTTEKLTKAVREIESGLQTREKLTEQIADLDSWVVTHLIREVSKSEDDELRSPADLDRRVRQIQETLAEAEKQAAVCEALLMESKDIASELSIAENCQLFNKLTNLQEDIRAISSYEKANKKELDQLTQTVDSCMKNLATVEKSFRSMLVDLDRHRFPITREFLQDLEPFKHMILDHKSQVDLLQPWIPQEETRELYSIISELESKMATLEMKSTDHERYLYMRQCVEDLMENIQEQIHQTKEDSKELEEKYKLCQTLTVQLPLIKNLSEETHSKLQMISADLYPSQLSAEQRRLKQNEVTLDMLEITLYNNLSIVEWNLLKELDLKAEKAAAQAFLTKTQQELQKVPVLETNETVIKNEYWRIMILKKTVESRMRAVEVLEQNKGTRRGSGSQNLMDLKNAVLSECDSQMENISEARKCLRSYTCAVRQAVQFLRDIEVSLLPPQGSAGLCSERLEETQQALASLQHHFQTHVEQLQSQDTLHPYLSPQTVEQLQERILSQLLVRMSTLQAMGHIRLDCLSRCAENHRKYSKCQDEIIQIVMSVERSLLQVLCQKVTCLTDCIDQHAKLNDLYEEVESLQKPLKELKEWCPEQSCCGGREAVVTAVWKRLARLLRCTRELTARSKQRVAEWGEITNSVEKASVVLEEVEAELPDHSGEKASTEELQDLLQSWEQNQDRLDCEHRALSALELRTARLLGVPAHLEQAPPTPLCQQLQAMQARYDSVKERSREGLEAARMELEGREKIREELHGIQVWLEAADGLLSEMEQSSSTEELQEVHSQLFTQKASLQRIMESLKMKYSDMYMLVPVDIEGQLQEVTQSLQQTGVKVGEVVQRSGPVHRLGAKLCEIQAGLSSVQKRLEQKSPTVTQAKLTQKCVWDKLDMWHSCLAALEVDMQDLEPEEVLTLTERLVEVQQLHSQLAKQAEQRTTLISKIRTWLQQHQEMINSSTSWMAEAQSWLAAPCTYTTAKCLSSHVQALQTVLDDSAQIRSTLQGFSSVLNEMSQVCDVTTLQQQLVEADREVASVQDSFTAPLSQLEHAAAEVEAIESEVRRMENDVAEIKTLLTSPESFPSPREESLKIVEQRIQSMRRTIAEIQKCKPGLCLPDKAEESLTVFTVVDQLQNLLLELEKKVPALFIQQPPTPIQAKAPSAQQATSQPQLIKSTSVEAEKDDVEQVQIRIAHVEADVLKRTGATLLTVQRSSPEQRQSWTPDSTQRERQDVLRAEEARESRGSEEQRVEEGEEGVLWWLWEAFLGIYPEEPVVVVPEETKVDSGQNIEWTGGNTQDVEGPTDTTAASSPEALSKPLGTVRTQSLPESMVNTTSKFDSEAQQKCVVS